MDLKENQFKLLQELCFKAFWDLLEKNNQQVKVKELEFETYYLIKYFEHHKNAEINWELPFINSQLLKLALAELDDSDIAIAVTNAAEKMFENSFNTGNTVYVLQMPFQFINETEDEQVKKLKTFFNEKHKLNN